MVLIGGGGALLFLGCLVMMIGGMVFFGNDIIMGLGGSELGGGEKYGEREWA